MFLGSFFLFQRTSCVDFAPPHDQHIHRHTQEMIHSLTCNGCVKSGKWKKETHRGTTTGPRKTHNTTVAGSGRDWCGPSDKSGPKYILHTTSIPLYTQRERETPIATHPPNFSVFFVLVRAKRTRMKEEKKRRLGRFFSFLKKEKRCEEGGSSSRRRRLGWAESLV